MNQNFKLSRKFKILKSYQELPRIGGGRRHDALRFHGDGMHEILDGMVDLVRRVHRPLLGDGPNEQNPHEERERQRGAIFGRRLFREQIRPKLVHRDFQVDLPQLGHRVLLGNFLTFFEIDEPATTENLAAARCNQTLGPVNRSTHRAGWFVCEFCDMRGDAEYQPKTRQNVWLYDTYKKQGDSQN